MVAWKQRKQARDQSLRSPSVVCVLWQACNWSVRSEDILKAHSVSQSDYQTVETGSQRNGNFPRGIYVGRRKGHQPEGDRVSLKGISYISNNLSDHLQDETKSMMMMGQWRAGPHLDCICLDPHVLYLNFELISDLHGFEAAAGSLCASSQCGHIEYISFLCFPLLVCPFRWLIKNVWDWTWSICYDLQVQ